MADRAGPGAAGPVAAGRRCRRGHLRAGTRLPAGGPRLLDRYARFLPLTAATPRLTLGEGATPLVRADRLGEAWGLRNLHLKFEGANPTGSFKDRGMVMAVAKALEAGARSIVCASTGNTSASAAAYGAAAGLEVVVVLPAGKIAAGKLLQAQAAGARVLAVRGNFDAALTAVRELADQDERPITLVNSVNPYRLEGQKTAAFEVCDDLGGPPDVLAIPVGNAGNISAYWMGFRAYREAGVIDRLPRMWGFQAAGAAPIVAGHPIEHPETFATAIRIGNPASWEKATAARDESGGPDRGGDRRRDLRRLPGRRPAGRHLLRARLGREPGRGPEAARRRAARSRRDGGLRADGTRPEGSRQRGPSRRAAAGGRGDAPGRHGGARMAMRVRAAGRCAWADRWR